MNRLCHNEKNKIQLCSLYELHSCVVFIDYGNYMHTSIGMTIEEAEKEIEKFDYNL